MGFRRVLKYARLLVAILIVDVQQIMKGMRIIFIANSGAKYNAARYYLSERRIFNGLVRNGHDVWFFGDREEVRALSPLGIRTIGRWRVGQKLLHVIRNFKPDAIFMLNANLITPGDLCRIKERHPNVKLVQIIYDPIFNAGNRAMWLARLEYVDCHFFTTGGAVLADFSIHQRPCYFIPNMTDRAIDVGRAFELDMPRQDVVCVMGSSPDRKDHERMLVELRSELSELRIVLRGFGGYSGVRGAEYIELLGHSAMAISLSHSVSNAV